MVGWSATTYIVIDIYSKIRKDFRITSEMGEKKTIQSEWKEFACGKRPM